MARVEACRLTKILDGDVTAAIIQGMLEPGDEIIYSKRKRLMITIKAGGRLVVRAPLGMKMGKINRFLQEEADFIAKARLKMLDVPDGLPRYAFREGEGIWYQGIKYPLRIIPGVKKGLDLDQEAGCFLLQADRAWEAAALLKEFYRQGTRDAVTRYARQYADHFHLKLSSIKVNSAKKRWGSCGGNNQLNFSYRLIMAPIEAVEYVVVHELAHTRQRNHSPAFWKVVREMMPGYEKPRDWLKKHGMELPEL